MSEKRPETSADIVTRSRAIASSRLRSDRARKGSYSVDLQHHMAECDANYHRLLRLFPDLKVEDIKQFSLALPQLNAQVEISVLERGPYTTMLKIALTGGDRWVGMTAPEMTVRVYHDAQSAEVVSYQNQNYFHGKYDYPNTRMRQRDEKVQVNRFLSEFLNLCLEHGSTSQPISF
ncbi:MAG: hypothetical protein ACI9ON_001014 [Limisphaerales bacterium]|jgi:uncharacterized protein YqiB (DUF1249 family)